MSFDTSVEVPLSCGVLTHAPVTFSLAESSRITVNGHSFTITPSEANATDPDNTAFLLEYENSPDIAGISIGNEAGEIMEANIIEGVYKSCARSVRGAVKIDPDFADDIHTLFALFFKGKLARLNKL